MKALSVLFLLAVTLVSCIAYAKDDVKPYKWFPLMSHKSFRTYFDINGIISRDVDGKRMNMGTLLTVYNTPITIKNDKGDERTGSSIISYVIIDCKSGVGMPTNDFLLVEKSPTLQSIPVAGMKYRPTDEIVFHLDRSAPLYQALCPEEI